jgi:hypothetical protein
VAKWGSAALTAAVALMWLLSLIVPCSYETLHYVVELAPGRLIAIERWWLWQGEDGQVTPHGWTHSSRTEQQSWWAAVGLPKHGHMDIQGFRSRWIAVPLFLPLLATALSSTFLWWLDRRRVPPGHCSCGYNLTGNVSGVCPECGTAVAVAPFGAKGATDAAANRTGPEGAAECSHGWSDAE